MSPDGMLGSLRLLLAHLFGPPTVLKLRISRHSNMQEVLNIWEVYDRELQNVLLQTIRSLQGCLREGDGSSAWISGLLLLRDAFRVRARDRADGDLGHTGWPASLGLLKFRAPFSLCSGASGFHVSHKLSKKWRDRNEGENQQI